SLSSSGAAAARSPLGAMRGTGPRCRSSPGGDSIPSFHSSALKKSRFQKFKPILGQQLQEKMLRSMTSMSPSDGLVIVKPIEVDQEIHIAVEGEQRVFGQWMKRSEKNARPQKSLGHGIALSRRFVGVAQEANRLRPLERSYWGFGYWLSRSSLRWLDINT